MAQSKIQWTEKTWNPTVGCNKVSQGCKLCYAEIMHKRQMSMNPNKYSRPFLDGAFPYEPALEIPLHWRKPAMIFVNSMSDLFHENVPFEFIEKVFAVMQKCEQHTFQILTKRPERAIEFFNDYLHWNDKLSCKAFGDRKSSFSISTGHTDFIQNIWLGTSVEDQATADERIPLLLQIPAVVRWLSCEPLLGEIDLKKMYKVNNTYHFKGIHWVVCGGESGHGARPMHPDWARKIRDDCNAAGVPFFFKQWGEWGETKGLSIPEYEKVLNNNKKLHVWSKYGMVKLGKKHSGRLLDGREWNEYPEVSK